MPAETPYALRALAGGRSLALTVAAFAATFALAQTPSSTLDTAAVAGSAPVERSALDATLFYQLLIGEIELRNGEAGNAYAVLLDAARRTTPSMA